ncbi:hypothetical protein QBE52_05340 [Clostridiaceae bacterium 35-E11]
MKKLLLFFLCSALGITAFIGCSMNKIPKNIDGFQIIHDITKLDQEIQDWVNPKKEKTGLYKTQFESDHYLLISLGNRKNYIVKKIDISREEDRFLFNVTIQESKGESKNFHDALVSPILLKTDYIDIHCDVKIIYE